MLPPNEWPKLFQPIYFVDNIQCMLMTHIIASVLKWIPRYLKGVSLGHIGSYLFISLIFLLCSVTHERKLFMSHSAWAQTNMFYNDEWIFSCLLTSGTTIINKFLSGHLQFQAHWSICPLDFYGCVNGVFQSFKIQPDPVLQ